MVKKSRLADGAVYLFIVVLCCVLISNFNFRFKDPLVIFTFFVNGIYFFCSIVFCRKNISLRRCFYIFNFVFFFLAPLNQYCSNTTLWRGNGLRISYSNSDYLYANVIILIFCVLFDIVYNYKKPVKKAQQLESSPIRVTYNTFFILDIVSIIAFLILLLSNNIFGRESFETQNSNLGTQLVNIMKGIPLAALSNQIIFWEQSVRHKRRLIAIPIIEIAIIYFPFLGTVSRFLLFGAYLTIYSLLFAKTKFKSIYPLIFVIGFGFVFSAFNFFKGHGLSDISHFSLGVVNFNHVDYDAYQLLMATVYYVRHYGLCYGRNILSAIFGFIPRSIWPGKAYPSGSIVMAALGSWFTNVSCPWIAEWYYAFGLFGIILGAIVSGILFKVVDSYFYGTLSPLMRGVFAVLTGFSIYILRGALLPTWNYTFAVIFGFFIVDIIVRFSVKNERRRTYE